MFRLIVRICRNILLFKAGNGFILTFSVINVFREMQKEFTVQFNIM